MNQTSQNLSIMPQNQARCRQTRCLKKSKRDKGKTDVSKSKLGKGKSDASKSESDAVKSDADAERSNEKVDPGETKEQTPDATVQEKRLSLNLGQEEAKADPGETKEQTPDAPLPQRSRLSLPRTDEEAKVDPGETKEQTPDAPASAEKPPKSKPRTDEGKTNTEREKKIQLPNHIYVTFPAGPLGMKLMGLDGRYCVIKRVNDGGVAQKLNLHANDRIVSIGDKKIPFDDHAFATTMGLLKSVPRPVEVVLYRPQQRIHIKSDLLSRNLS